MKKGFNVEKLDGIFDLEGTTVSDISIMSDDLSGSEEPLDMVTINDDSGEGDDFIDDELRGLIETCKQMMDGAKYLISSCPDAESIAAAANLVSSLGTIMSEFNKAVLLHKKFNRMEKLESMKIKARKELVKLRADLEQKKVQIGDGNTFIQNNLVSYSQEDIVRNIIAEENAATR